MNKVIICGQLGADPEVRYTQAGLAIMQLRVATNERVKKGEEWADHTEWHSVTQFGKRAEALSKFLRKGRTVAVEGSLRTTSWEKDGTKRYKTEIVASDIEPVGSGSKTAADGARAVTNAVQDDSDLPF